MRHACTHCEKSYTRKTALQSHMRTHDAQEMLECQVQDCSFKTKWPETLRRHGAKIHEDGGARLFPCRYRHCDQVFAQRSHLIRHLERVSHQRDQLLQNTQEGDGEGNIEGEGQVNSEGEGEANSEGEGENYEVQFMSDHESDSDNQEVPASPQPHFQLWSSQLTNLSDTESEADSQPTGTPGDEGEKEDVNNNIEPTVTPADGGENGDVNNSNPTVAPADKGEEGDVNIMILRHALASANARNSR